MVAGGFPLEGEEVLDEPPEAVAVVMFVCPGNAGEEQIEKEEDEDRLDFGHFGRRRVAGRLRQVDGRRRQAVHRPTGCRRYVAYRLLRVGQDLSCRRGRVVSDFRHFPVNFAYHPFDSESTLKQYKHYF